MFRAHAFVALAGTSAVVGLTGLAALAGVVGLAGCGGAGPDAAGPSNGETVVLGKPKVGKAAPAVPGHNVPAIKVDTVGWPAGWRKVAVFNVDPIGAVIRDAAGKVVMTIAAAQVRELGVDAASKDPVWQVDFSELKTAGTYTFEQAGGGAAAAKSDPFVIGADDLYADAVTAGVKSFYFQRTRTALPLPFATWKGDAYTRAKASHVHGDVGWDLEDFPAKKRKWTVEGGWHDAGNFDMYVPSTAPSAQALLLAYEWSPAAFDDKITNLPESGNGIPDILDEARWGLIWVLSMQEPGGAFRLREAVMGSSPEGAADKDTTERWIAGPSTAATAKAVAALAVASRVYARFDKPFAKRCEAAARKGWAYLVAHPERIRADGKGADQPLWDDEPGNTETGARFIAAVEVWRQFRDDDALAKAQKLMSEPEVEPKAVLNGAWANLSRWGLATLAFDDKTPAKLRGEARKRLLAAVEPIRERVEAGDGYRCASALTDYYWAHNSQLMEKTHLLAVAARLAPDQAWLREAARDQWHWVLGRNPNGYSMITRVGKGPTSFYHMEWGDKDPPPPGFLVGGPNAVDAKWLSPDAPAKALLWDNPTALRSGTPAHAMWHWKQTDLWDSGFVPEGQWSSGWWTVIEPDIIYSANYVLAAVAVQ